MKLCNYVSSSLKKKKELEKLVKAEFIILTILLQLKYMLQETFSYHQCDIYTTLSKTIAENQILSEVKICRMPAWNLYANSY